jgi:hypothetical protein
MDYDSHSSKWYVIPTFGYFILNYRDFRRFSRVMARLDTPEIQENTGGMGYSSHPSKIVCHIAFISIFLSILCWTFVILGVFHVLGSSMDTREHNATRRATCQST